GTGPLAGLFGGGGLFGPKIVDPWAGLRLPSFDGGGSTGFGSRSGGIDGKGGFPAILHPNETVVDHAKGGGGGTQNVNVTVGVSVDQDGNLQAYVKEVATETTQRGIDTYRKGHAFTVDVARAYTDASRRRGARL